MVGNKWKKVLAAAVVGTMMAGFISGCGTDSAPGKKKVGIVQIVQHPALDEANKGFVAALNERGLGDKVEIDQQNAQGDQSNLNSIASRFVSSNVDLICAISTPAAQAMANATDSIPIVGTAITSYTSAKLMNDEAHPDSNVTGTSDRAPLDKQLALIKEIQPDIKTLGVLYNSSEANSVVQVANLKKACQSMGIQVKELTVNNVNDIQQVAEGFLGKVDAILTENEQVRGEVFQPTERIKVYILEVKDTSKGPKILVSRTHPELVKRLFESEVTEVREGIVEIKAIAREAGSRTKIAVWSNDPDVDPVGACVGMNGARVNAIVNELRGEKIDIITWNENPAMMIENALSPAKVISVIADAEEKSAKVIVPDYQLSLAIGKEGQNARLAARLTGFKIDIKSETQAREMGLFEQMGLQYGDTPAPSFEEDSFEEDSYEETENYPEYEEGYQEDGNGQE